LRPGFPLHRTALACLALAVASFALYGRAIGYEFVNYDDTTVLLGNPQLYDERSLPASLYEIFVGSLPREEPLLVRDVSWAVDARVFGFANAAGYHLGNVLANAANVVLLFLFLQHATRRFGLALATAGIFAVLPVHVEPVAWVMGRKDMLSAFFVLAALLAQSHELASADPRRSRPLYLLTILLTGLALLSKIAAVSAVLVLGLHRVFAPYLDGSRPARTPLDWNRVLRVVVPKMLPHAFVTVAIVLWYQRIVAAYGVIGWRGPGPLDPEHLRTVAAFTPLIVGQYFRSLVWPTQLSMSYRWPHVEIPLTTGEQLAAVGIALAAGAALLYAVLRRRDLAFYGMAFVSLLLPYLNLVFVDIWRADRYLYLASFCVVAGMATLLVPRDASVARGMGRRLRFAAAGVAVLFAIGSAIQTLRQQSVWRSNESLWLHEASLDEPSLLGIQALAASLVKQAEQERDVRARAVLVRRARAEIARGFARDRDLDRQPAGYATAEPLQLSHLHNHLGRLAALEGASLEEQVAHFARSHEIAPNRRSAFRLAEACRKLAEQAPAGERERWARASLTHFLEYVELSGQDPARQAHSATLLAGLYESRFPFLRDEISVARERYFP
jgi:hypothetical protein